MKLKLLIIFTLITVGAVVYAMSGLFESVVASSDGRAITIEWRTSDEAGVKYFVVERGSGKTSYQAIASKTAKGSPSVYKHVDEDGLMKKFEVSEGQLQSDKVYTYRIKAVYNDKKTFTSDAVYVMHKTSSFRRTWGMIKEMFR
ncbi:MAG: hypothetical protein ACM3U1_12665 [Chloroflexota bacterium]